MRKGISVLLIISMIAALCLTGCGFGGFGGKASDGKKKTVGAIKTFVPEGWETDTAHSGKSSDDYSIFLKKDGLDTQYVWIRATDEAGVDAAMDASITDEIDDFETGKIAWEGNKDLVWTENKGTYFLAFVYGLEFSDADVKEILSSLKLSGKSASASDDSDDSGDGPGGILGDDSGDGSGDASGDGDDFDWSQYGIEDEPVDENIDYKAKYDGTWYGYWSFGNCTGKFENTTDAYFNCYCLIDMNEDGTGSYKLYNSWDEVGNGEFEAASDGRLVCTSGMCMGAPINLNNWIFYPCPGKDNMLSVDDTVTDADGDVLEYAFYIRPWGQNWKDMEDNYVYRELLNEGQAKMDRGEDPPMGHANPTYYNP